MRELLFLLLVLACPLTMVLMMRGGHGHGGHSHASVARGADQRLSADELKRLRADLDRLIEERGGTEARTTSDATPVSPKRGHEQLR